MKGKAEIGKSGKRKPGAPPNKGGRPSAYRVEYANIAHGFALVGCTDKEMAGFFSVSEQTFNAWKHKHPKFLESIKRGKDLADAEVARGLFKAATGHTVKSVKILQHEGQSYEHEFLEYHPPNPTAGIFWLKNRQRDKWRDVTRVAPTDAAGNDLASTATVEELKSELARSGLLDAKGRFVTSAN